MAEVTKTQILDSLCSVKLNDKDIVSADMIDGIALAPSEEGTKVSVILKISPGDQEHMGELKTQVEKAVSSIAGVFQASVVFTAHQKQHDHGQAHRQGPADNRAEKASLQGIKHIIAVASGKGGVGKSTTAVNLAEAFVQKGLKTGLLDADVYGPSIPRMLGLMGEQPVEEEDKIVPLDRYGMKVMSMGFLVPEDKPMIWRGPMVHSAVTQMLRDVAWGDLDVLVVDLPPGTGDAQLTMSQSVPLSGAVLVSTPQDIALIDVRKAIAMFQRVDIPILGIIENMSTFICPHCGNRSDIFGHGGARDEAKRLEIPYLGEIPLTLILRQKMDEGLCLSKTGEEGPLAEAYLGLAERIWKALNA